MRLPLALVLAAGLSFPALAQVGSPPPPKPAAQPEAPKGIPVPDGPVVNKQELEGGLIIEDLKIGDGYVLKEGGAAVAYYHGTLKADGKEFDSAFRRGQPESFVLPAMIAGWQKGIPGMKVGGIRRLTVPAALAYGPQGNGSVIPPNSDLVFVIQVVDALQVEDLKAGDGETAEAQFVAVTAQTIKDKDGKEIQKLDAAHPYIWLPGEMSGPGGRFDAMQEGINGMKVGGKRRITIPAEMDVTPPQLNTTRPQNVPLVIDVDLVAVRNLPAAPGSRRR